ncbi:MAG: arsenite methyltransferase [Promethearchaeota archaeon]
MNEDEIRAKVRERYGQIAQANTSCCGPNTSEAPKVQKISESMGYTKEDLAAIPTESNLGLGCGNPTALASIQLGEVVVDLGSGAGIDCFLAVQKVGKTGKVIGIDMTQNMIDKARKFAREENYDNVEFRLGEIEHLPVANDSADLVISNCVINLSPDKEQVFKEIYRILKPGGRILVSDIVLEKELPENIKKNPDMYAACVSGALLKEDYLNIIQLVGLKQIETTVNYTGSLGISSINVSATKPKKNS